MATKKNRVHSSFLKTDIFFYNHIASTLKPQIEHHPFEK